MGCGADTEANALFPSLVGDIEFVIPNPNLDDITIPDYSDISVEPIDISTLVNDNPSGDAAFNDLMRGFKGFLQVEFEKSRITGADYTKAFIALTEGAMSNAVQFLLQKDVNYWQGRAAQAAAVTAEVNLQTAKVQLAAIQLEAQKSEAEYALTKMQLATQSIAYCTAKYQLDNIFPEQLILTHEQAEQAHAQTSDMRLDGVTPIGGVLGEQKLLYAQQITSYIRNAEVSAAKLFTDSWITQKTIDEGLDPPDGFTNDSINDILTDLKTKNFT